MSNNILQTLADELNIKLSQAEATVKLIDEGNTIPFIARYRKEVTGSLNDEILRKFDERLTYLRNLEARKEQIIASIDEQGKLTAELKEQIENASTLVAVEDLYLPYRPKKRTRATIAKEKGLEPLADLIISEEFQAEDADSYINPDKEVLTREEAITGASDIIAERISDNAGYRTYIRNYTFNNGSVSSTAKDEAAESVYEMYYNFEEPVKKIAGHRILAINRGEKEKILSVKININEEDILTYLTKMLVHKNDRDSSEILKAALADSYKRLIAPAIERDIRNELTERAEDGAISVFGKNLCQLLMQPPIAGQVVLGWDPAFRTGCKLAVVDATGKVLDTTVIFPTAPQNKIEESKKTVLKLIDKYN
ncbi:MAG: RNA-binding transcriptional accessory protein, partial [Lachnospiraceae bacterium]|nr:RNA-binding transcriptional accessory protein [Lachnospiraceae bacterium]